MSGSEHSLMDALFNAPLSHFINLHLLLRCRHPHAHSIPLQRDGGVHGVRIGLDHRHHLRVVAHYIHLAVGVESVVAMYAGCPLIGMVAVTVFVLRFTTDTEHGVVPVPVPQGRLKFPAFATYARE